MKRTSKTNRILTLFLSLTLVLFIGYACDGGSGVPNGSSGCNGGGGGGDYDTDGDGPYKVAQDLKSGPNNNSGLHYPTSGSGPFPIFVFAAGSGISPSISGMVEFGRHIATWGFIVVVDESTGTGSEQKNAITWLENQNTRPGSPLYGKCNMDKIAAGGHSLGSISAFAMANDPRLTTTIHISGGSMNGNGANNLRNPAAFIVGGNDAMGSRNAEVDYQKATVPVFMTLMEGVSHGMAFDNSQPAVIAWMLWHLSGETQRRGDFLNRDGFFQTGPWDSKTKNW